MTYDKNVRPIKLRTKEYFDVAYVDGYIDGHLYLLASDDQRKVFPTYYVLGNAGPLQTYDEFQKALARAPKIHKAAHKLAERSVKAIPAGTKIGPHHPPIL